MLAGFLDRLFSRRRRIEHPAARRLFDRLLATDAPYRRAEFWLSSAFRDFRELASREAAGARARTLGSGGGYLRTADRRAMAEKARALLGNRAPRIFAAPDSLTPGGALGLERPLNAARAARALRERHATESRGRRGVWIAVDPERWDALSRRAFETAAAALGEEIETVLVPAATPPALMPDEWRREIFVPCGTLNASLRFYDELASLAREDPSRARDLAETAVRSADWAAFAGDPTGDAPLPAMRLPAPAAAIALSRSRRPENRRGPGRGPDGPGRRLVRLIAGGRTREALREAQGWIATSPRGAAEPWFGLSARLAAVAGEGLPAWLEALEAEREIAGGRLEEAEKRLARAAEAVAAPEDERRRAKLRLAEVCALRGRMKEAGQAAAAWRGAFADAPAEEIVRALLLAAKMRDREGEHEAALVLLDRADGVGSGLSTAERLEAALVRAAVYSHAGRFREEKETYDQWRPAVLETRDDLLTARLLSHEALGLSDRREFAQAVARLEEALAVTQDDAIERARVSIDLAATLYHAGREGRCRELLEEAIRLAGAAGHEELARVARTNRLELLINAREWTAAASETEALLVQARADGDDRKLLVALRYRSRLALRRGHLREAARDNAEARRLAE